MNKLKIGAAAATLICMAALRLMFTYTSTPLPFDIGFLDCLTVIAGATLLVFCAYEYIIKRYPDTREMLPMFSLVIWAIMVCSYTILRYKPEYQTSLSILVTGSFVGMGWWIQAITTAANARRSHTLNIIMASRTSSEYQQQARASSKLYNNAVIPPELAEWRFNGSKEEYKNAQVPQDVSDAIQGTIYILNYFEFLAQGIKYRDLDDCLLRECFSGILAGTERRGFHLIIEAQKTDPKNFEGLVNLTKAWNKESLVERYRSNPDNASIGIRHPEADVCKNMLDPKVSTDEASHPHTAHPSLATNDGVNVVPPPTAG
ncbi:DUF4760 domain-containing protein [Pseudomonas sp. CBMAI 2609]|uniref:DUF4760 domain-containing protein n=1 Tax=Pseudomonas flavocrustae TaxID=2991719 RepID=A0ABT6IH67_9PSED|nr:DUF4760 domain-containing protein [Pseudomonas sp. CBMAI 2609]MDH4763379.1 DUF4760 domain-containing protein [Pseudomonas sp. CBMAI 2609]